MKIILKLRDIVRWCIRTLCADLLEDISRIQQYNFSTFAMHQKAFPQFKGIYTGKDVVVVACGPTAKDYKPIEGAIHIGVNHAIYLKNVQLDYLFLMDAYKARKDNEMPDYNNYRKGKCVKFYGITSFPMNNTTYVPSESDPYDLYFQLVIADIGGKAELTADGRVFQIMSPPAYLLCL